MRSDSKGTRLFNYKTNEEIQVVNMYSIQWTVSGPIAKRMITVEHAFKNPDAYVECLKLGTNLYNYEEARKIIVNWFLERAMSIEKMEENTYAGTPDDEQMWRKFIEKKPRV